MRRWIAPLIVAASIIITALVFPRLPATIPTHWNLAGEVDGYSSRVWGAWIMPAMLLLLWGMLRWLPVIDPRGANYAKFSGAFEGMIVLVMLFVFAAQVVILASALGQPVPIDRLAPAGIGLLLIGLGNLLPRARPNWFLGIRTPWTLSNDRVWERTHRVGGYFLVAGGSLTVVATIVAPPLWAFRAMIGVCAASALFLLIYSYVAWRQERGTTETVSQLRG
jgi:uncharacterized membrane protein